MIEEATERHATITTPLATAWNNLIRASDAVNAGYAGTADEYEMDRRECELEGARQALSDELLSQGVTTRMVERIGAAL
tara:strand:+ start:4988 stop:5224 length:237 start_codon:yes stop_codon:yes gene_type:complete